MNREDFETGIIMGLCLPPVPQIPGEPTAYNYNGTILPKLPEWDRGVYPYVFVTHLFSLIYTIHVASSVEYVHNENGHWSIPAIAIASYDKDQDTGWNMYETPLEGHPAIDGDQYVWANFDVKNEDGSIHLPASEPVPVYE